MEVGKAVCLAALKDFHFGMTEREVAVKLVKAGMDTREVVARFKSERQALALMDHPAIASVSMPAPRLQGGRTSWDQ
jgi:hypothetical protein